MLLGRYERSKAVLNPFSYEEYRKQKVKEKVQNKAEKRIALKTPVPKVDPCVALCSWIQWGKMRTNGAEPSLYRLIKNWLIVSIKRNLKMRRMTPAMMTRWMSPIGLVLRTFHRSTISLKYPGSLHFPSIMCHAAPDPLESATRCRAARFVRRSARGCWLKTSFWQTTASPRCSLVQSSRLTKKGRP